MNFMISEIIIFSLFASREARLRRNWRAVRLKMTKLIFSVNNFTLNAINSTMQLEELHYTTHETYEH